MAPPITLSAKDLRSRFPDRPVSAYKHQFGHLLVVGGDHGYGGAVILAGSAALRSGAGLVTVATRMSHVAPILSVRPELMPVALEDPHTVEDVLVRKTVLALGPGLGQSAWSKAIWTRLVESSWRMVLDADGLNFLADYPQVRTNTILTPHAGEAGRLLGGSSESVQADRMGAVQALQEKYGGVVVLKGANTLIKGPGDACYSCPYGNPGMATPGMGDVLTGCIAGLLGQGLSLMDSACMGVVFHALAGDVLRERRGEVGLLAMDVVEMLPEVIGRG